jgi:ethanolamine utilization protein EutA
MSSHAEALFDHLQLGKRAGDELSSSDVDALMSLSVSILEDACRGLNVSPLTRRLEQAPFQRPSELTDIVFTFSGGVGELIYRHLRGEVWPATTCYGDLGIDLARHIVASPFWADSLTHDQPSSGGRATVYGLLRHATEISGNTLFLGDPDMLPLNDMPILGHLDGAATSERIGEALALVRASSRGGCLQVRLASASTASVRAFGQRMGDALEQVAFPRSHPLILLVEENVGKTLGHYVTRWGSLPLRILVIDELPLREAQYVRIGAPRSQVVPVSCYGFLPQGDAP